MQALFVLFGFAIVAGIGALLLRSFVLTVAFAVALALMAFQWSSAHEHAQATVAVGVDAQDARMRKVDAGEVDASFLSQLAAATLNGNSQRFDIAANGSNVTEAASSVTDATRRIESYVTARVPSSSAADAQVTREQAALTAATARPGRRRRRAGRVARRQGERQSDRVAEGGRVRARDARAAAAIVRSRDRAGRRAGHPRGAAARVRLLVGGESAR